MQFTCGCCQVEGAGEAADALAGYEGERPPSSRAHCETSPYLHLVRGSLFEHPPWLEVERLHGQKTQTDGAWQSLLEGSLRQEKEDQ